LGISLGHAGCCILAARELEKEEAEITVLYL